MFSFSPSTLSYRGSLMDPVIPEPEDPNFVSWMRREWLERTSTGDEVEFWKFVKLVTDPWED